MRLTSVDFESGMSYTVDWIYYRKSFGRYHVSDIIEGREIAKKSRISRFRKIVHNLNDNYIWLCNMSIIIII